jgi:hypothetical protein
VAVELGVVDLGDFDRPVVEFMEDLMSANRITFECERIRLVG